MKKLILISLTSLMMISMVAAQPGRGMRQGNGPGPGCNFEYRACNVENLSEEQSSQIQKIRLEHQKNNLELQNKMNVLQAEYKSLISSPAPDLKAVDANIEKRQEIRTALMKDRARMHLEIRNQLNDEQKIIFDSKTAAGRGAGRGMYCRRVR